MPDISYSSEFKYEVIMTYKKLKGGKIQEVKYENRYLAIKKLDETEVLSIVLLYDIANGSHAAYYKLLNRKPSLCELEKEKIIKEMKALHQKGFVIIVSTRNMVK